jgi:N-acetylmuramoyl-L-alanine amidase
MVVMGRRLVRSIRLAFLPAAAALGFLAGTAVGQQVEIWVGDRGNQLDTRVREGQYYCRVDQLAEVLGLGVRERESRLTVTGPRGSLELTSDRPLVRLGEQYILVSGDVWQRRRGEWYVPDDFLDNVLPLILDRRLSRMTRTSFRLDRLDENQVRVEVLTYPDHLSVIFHSSLPAPVEVRDLRDHVAVTFGEHLVKPGNIEQPSERDLVSGIRFEAQEAMGGFHIQKGRDFARYHRYRFSDPPRVVVDIYGPEAASRAEATPDSAPEAGEVRPPSAVDPAPPGDRRETGVVVIDPGHGGEDYGVDVHQDVLEKMLALELSRLIDGALQRGGERTLLTRFRDVALATEQRSAVTNFHEARAYIGIHIGGAPSPELRGPVVYVYEPVGGAGNPDLQGVDESAGVGRLVRWDEAQLAHLGESRRLAGLLQTELNRLFEVENAVVRAPLAVLGAVKAPAVLIEAGFLTNPEDRELLYSREFQSELAELVAGAVRRFAWVQ